MKNIRKYMSSLLIFTMAASFCACGSTASNSEKEESQAVTSSAAVQETQTAAATLTVSPATEKDAYFEAMASEALAPLYHHIKLTGTKLNMEQVYSVKDLVELAEYAWEQDSLKDLCVTAEATIKGQDSTVYGLDLVALLKLCGADFSEDMRIMLTAEGEEAKMDLREDTPAVLVMAVDGKLLENGLGLLVQKDGVFYAEGVDFLMYGNCCDNPHYEMHNRAPHDASADITFTFNVYKDGTLDQTLSMTTAELEALAVEEPAAVYGGYYGVIGDKESFVSMGGGGFLDYFEGIRFDYLMKEKLGIQDFKGHAELFNRDEESYAVIEDLSYFTQNESDYYMCDSEGGEITGLAVPVLAYAKNGSPLLPEHEHESDAYVPMTPVKELLEGLGIEKVNLGTVKNHSGPFVAALGDCEGYYGGYQIETGADCVRMDIYLD